VISFMKRELCLNQCYAYATSYTLGEAAVHLGCRVDLVRCVSP
jgi:hypothetical protein